MNKKLCIYAIAAILFWGGAGYSQEEVSSVDYDLENSQNLKGNKAFQQGKAALEEKDFQSAIVYFTSYINSKPKKYEGYKLRGDAFYALRQYSLAQKDYQTAVDLKTADDKFITNTKYVSAVVLGADKNEQLQNPELGELYARLMYSQKALNNPAYEQSYSKAVKYNSHMYLPQPEKKTIALINCPQKYGKVYNPEGTDKYIYGAIDDIEKEDYNEAVYKSQEVISAYPKYYLGYYLSGVAFYGLEKYEDAEKSFNFALKYNPYDFESYASLGVLYFDLAEKKFNEDDARKSISYFKQALKYNPNCYLYHFYIGMNNLQLGNPDLAISDFNKAIALKSDDFNSIYYKLIALYTKDDYEAVIKGTEPLLYRNLSNRNSILYLKALSLYKLGKYDEALDDVLKIQNRIEDIYNADLIKVSKKEETLISYLYYLKSQIHIAKKEGCASDMEKALKNPIIAMLNSVQRAEKTYQKKLSQPEISLSDYKQYESFYNTSLPKLLKSGAVISVDDIDNQYDYIRTTFSDLGLSFKYNDNNTYNISTIEGYPYKKYSSKLKGEDKHEIASSLSKNIVEETVETVKPQLRDETSDSEKIKNGTAISAVSKFEQASNPDNKKGAVENLKQSSPETDLIGDENKNSLALMLSQSNISPSDKNVYEQKDTKLEQVSENISIKSEQKSHLSEENKSKMQQILDEEKTIHEPDGSTKIVAEEVKNTPDVKITYSDKKSEPSVKTEKTEEVIEKQETISEEKPSEPVKESEKTAKKTVNEKFAKVDLNNYNVPKPNYDPNIGWNDEIISLPQEDKFLKNKQAKAAKQINSETQKISESVSNVVSSQKEAKVEQVEKVEEIKVPEIKTDTSDSEKNATKITSDKQTEQDANNKSDEVLKTSDTSDNKAAEVELRPKAELSESDENIVSNTEQEIQKENKKKFRGFKKKSEELSSEENTVKEDKVVTKNEVKDEAKEDVKQEVNKETKAKDDTKSSSEESVEEKDKTAEIKEKKQSVFKRFFSKFKRKKETVDEIVEQALEENQKE